MIIILNQKGEFDLHKQTPVLNKYAIRVQISLIILLFFSLFFEAVLLYTEQVFDFT